MFNLLLSFIAGILTVLAPCVLPLLPVILGTSATSKSLKKALTIVSSLCASVILITVILLYFAQFANFRTEFFTKITAVVLMVYGIVFIFPELWENVSTKFNLQGKSNSKLFASSQKRGLTGDILVGLSLGPVFNSCSPTFFIIVLPLLQQNFVSGIWFLLAYVIGLFLALITIAYFGNSATKRLKWAADPKGVFKKILGVLFILLGTTIFFGLEKKFEAYLLQNSEFYIRLIDFEREQIR